MNVGKLKRVAIKEFTRSPAKTGILLAMLPVALYFCVPLTLGTIQKSSPATSPAEKVVKQAAFVLPASKDQAATPQRVERRWIEVARSLADDLLAVPARIPVEARNPFLARGREVALTDSKKDDRTRVARDPIRELGLRLNATIIGQRSGLATINGKTYRTGDTIPVVIDADLPTGAVTTVPLQLSEVGRRSVVLQMGGHLYRLQLRSEEMKDAIVVKSPPK